MQMKTLTKMRFAIIVILTALAVLIPTGNIQAKSITKLGAKDFTYTVNGEKHDFLKESPNSPFFFYCTYKIMDKKNVTGGVKGFRTNRKVQTGSTESYVRKQYGNATKTKVSNKDRFYKIIKYGYCEIDISTWESYMTYSYKKSNDQYMIRFYLNKKKNVAAIVFIKNLNGSMEYSNKEIKCGMSFKTPNGKKVTTKKINGKTVYLLPEGTKISFNKNKSKPSLKQIYIDSLMSYDKYGKVVNAVKSENGDCSQGNNYDPRKDFKTINVNDYKSSKYLYHVMTFVLANYDPSYAPYHFYFRIV